MRHYINIYKYINKSPIMNNSYINISLRHFEPYSLIEEIKKNETEWIKEIKYKNNPEDLKYLKNFKIFNNITTIPIVCTNLYFIMGFLAYWPALTMHGNPQSVVFAGAYYVVNKLNPYPYDDYINTFINKIENPQTIEE